MTQFFVKLLAGDTITLDFDLDQTTVAAVKAIVDAPLEADWRASGVRILRSDLPFCGIRLIYCGKTLPLEEKLSSCGVGKEATLHAQWPLKSEKYLRRKRYGKGWDNETCRHMRIREEKEYEREERRAEKKALREAAKKTSSKVMGNTTSSATETGVNELASPDCASDDRPHDKTQIEAQEDFSDTGGEDAHGLSEEIAEEEQDEQQMEEEEQEERPTGEVGPMDPFADEDSDKENQEPQAFAPVVENRAADSPQEEWLAFDESNSGIGLDLQEEVLEF